MNINNNLPVYPQQRFEQHMGDIPFATVQGHHSTTFPNPTLNEPSQRQQVPVSSVSSTHSSPRFIPGNVVPSSPFNLPVTSSYMSNHGNNNQPNGNNSVFVGDLSYFCTEIELASLFSPFGGILSVEIKRGRHGDSLMHGFVEFVNNDDANRAVQEINGIKFMGRKIRVNWANQKIPHNTDAATWIQVHVNFLTPNITMKVNEEFLESVFLPFGSLDDVVVKRHLSSPSQVTGYAFVYFYDIYAALRAIFAFKNNGNGTSSYSTNSVNNVFFECCLSYKAEQFLTENMQGIAGVIKRQQSSNPSAFFKQLEHSQPHQQQHHHHSALQPSPLHQLQPSPQHPFSQISSLPPSPPQFQVPSHSHHVNSFSRMNGNVMNENHHTFPIAPTKHAKSPPLQSMLVKSSVPTPAPANHNFTAGATNGHLHPYSNVPSSASTTAMRTDITNFANIEGFQQHYFAKMGIANLSPSMPNDGDQARKVSASFVPSKPVTMQNGNNASDNEPNANSNRNFLLGQFYRPLSSSNNLLSNSESQGYATIAGSKSMDYFSSSNNSSSNSIQLSSQNVSSFPATANVGGQQSIVIESAESSLYPSRVTTTMRVPSGADFETLFADVSK